MKREAFRHPKTIDLASRLNVSRLNAVGLVAGLLDWCADTSPQGNVGRWPDAVIAGACDWTGDATAFVMAFVESGWIDRCDENRLVIHDLADHAPQWWKQKISKLGKTFLTATVRRESTGSEPAVNRQCGPSEGLADTAGSLNSPESAGSAAAAASILLCSTPLTSTLQTSEIASAISGAVAPAGEKPHPKKPTKRFVPPTVSEVRAYCVERKNGIDAEAFVDHYEANGWKQGKGKPVADWKACVRTWEARRRAEGKPPPSGSEPNRVATQEDMKNWVY